VFQERSRRGGKEGLPHERGGEAQIDFQLNPKGRPIYALKISYYLVIFFKILCKVHNFKELKIPGPFSMTLTLSLPESVMETYEVLLTFQSVDEITWCDHSNESSSAVLLHGTIYIEVFYKMKFEICLKF